MQDVRSVNSSRAGTRVPCLSWSSSPGLPLTMASVGWQMRPPSTATRFEQLHVMSWRSGSSRKQVCLGVARSPQVPGPLSAGVCFGDEVCNHGMLLQPCSLLHDV